MGETVLDRAAELTRTRVPFVQATVVRAQRPTSSKPGDTALLQADGVIDGFLGGTCAEASVREFGLRVLSSNQPLLLRIVPEEVARVAEEGAVTVVNPCLSGGAMEIFLEPRLPAPRVVVIGDTPVAHALAILGGPLGLAVELGDRLPDGNDAALVVASHGRGEEAALTAALRAGVPYVGLIASRRRAAAVLAGLDVTPEQRDRVHSPAGLDIGARTAAEIALSVLAQIVAERRAAADRLTTPTLDPSGSPVGSAASVRSADSAGLAGGTPGRGGDQATAVDPVCGMTVAAVAASLHAVLDGTTTWFCGAGCRQAFLADPERYADPERHADR